MRTCRVTVTGVDGTSHRVDVQAASLFEAASAALTAFRQEGWAAEALTPNARLRVEVRPPATVHEVLLKAVEQWRRSPAPSPKEYAAKRRFTKTDPV